MKLSVALLGNLERDMQQLGDRIAAANKRGISKATEGMKRDWRGQVTGSGLSQRLANTVRSKVYPESGTSIEAAGVIFTRAPDIMRSFDKGLTIRAKSKKYLAVPTKANTKRYEPWQFKEAGIELRYVPPAGARRFPLLVADQFRVDKRGRARYGSARAQKTGRGLAAIPMFVLVPTVRMPRLLDVEGLANRWIGRAPGLIAAEFNRG